MRDKLFRIYSSLFACYGPQNWWPGEGPFEIIVGAILTQSAAWGNVEKAIGNLKKAGALSPQALRSLPLSELSHLIYPSGYYNAKAIKLKAFAERLGEGYNNDLEELFSLPIPELRSELLSIHGIGQETADSIILYAAGRPVFVIDAYTRRIVRRLGLGVEGNSYESFQALFTENLPHDEALFNEYHALLVHHGKSACRRAPICSECCLSPQCLTFDTTLTKI